MLNQEAVSRAKPMSGRLLRRSHPLAANLQNCWPLNEGAGLRVNDYAASLSQGLISGGVTFGGGPTGAVTRFDGTTGYINIGNSQDYYGAGTTRLTIATFFRYSTNSADVRIITFLRAAASSGIAVGVNRGGSGPNLVYAVGRDAGNAVVTLSDPATSNDNLIHHVAFVIDGANARLYKDGLVVASASNIDSTNTFTSGAFPADIGGFNHSAANLWLGDIEALWIWRHRALTETEVRQHQAQPYAMFLPLRVDHGMNALAGGFQPAWAKNANRLISGGVWGG